MPSRFWPLALMLCGLRWPAAQAATPDADGARLIQALAGQDAVAEHAASRRLVTLGDPAVPALARLAGGSGPLAPRLLAVERLGEIRTRAALDALLEIVRCEQDLAVRGQLCMQLGWARERRAIPLLADWMRTVNSLADVPGPKEKQPSTCFIRHAEAIEMIGDESAIPILEELAPKVAQIAPGGFLQNFVSEGVKEAIAGLRARAAFWREVRTHPGLEGKVGPLLDACRASDLARLRLHEHEIVRRTEQGRQALARLARHADPAVAAGAKALLQAGW